MELELAKEQDAQRIFEIYKAATWHMDEMGILQWSERYPTLEDITDDIANRWMYVGMIDGSIAVAATLNDASDEEYRNGAWQDASGQYAVIHRLCVNPCFQHQGIARKAMMFLEEQAKANGKQSIRLDVFTQNPYAQRLYLSLGYQPSGKVKWFMGEFLLMEKML